MSVLSFPRIYFKGFVEWDPCTFNNNDWQEFPTYDGAKVSLNWPFLATQNPPITPQNFTSAFRPWAIELQQDDVDSPSGPRVPAEWNMFGSHSSKFVQQGGSQSASTVITGGALSPTSFVSSDPLMGGPVVLDGDSQYAPAVLVDTNPFSFWSSQIYWGTISFGNAKCRIAGPRNFRMHSRWLNLNRIANPYQSLTYPAGGVSCCWQTAIPFADVTWPAAGTSPLADALQKAASQPGALGIMIRFSSYVNLYFQNGIMNTISPTPRTYTELAAALGDAWAAFQESGDTSKFFSQPCYSHAVGVIGVWNEGEVASAPVGRYLVAANPVSPIPAPARVQARGHAVLRATAESTPPPAVPFGPVVATIENGVLSLDFNSAIPEEGYTSEEPPDLTKANFGPLSVGVMTNGAFHAIASIPYTQYDRSAYEASAGIIDVPLSSSSLNGPLAIQAEGQTVLVEQMYSAQTDSRGIYLDESGTASFTINVYGEGALAPNANVLIARYGPGAQTPADFGNLTLVPVGDADGNVQVVNFTNGTTTNVTVGSVTTEVAIVTADETGVATVDVSAQAPGFLVLAFYPYASGDAQPVPPANIGPGPTPFAQWITYQYYTTVRVHPFDDAVPQAFCDLWNTTHDSTQAWNFIYTNILYVYDMLFSVMLQYVNLGSQSTVEQSIQYIWPVIAADAAEESSGAMPVTRDMSAGNRLTLQLWIYLVANKYAIQTLTPASIPAGWAPSP